MPVSPLTGKSEGAMARQALDGRSNRAGTLGVTPGATSRDESAHWSPVISSERQSVRVKGGGKKGSSINQRWYEWGRTKHHLNDTARWPGASGEVMVQTWFCQNGLVMMPKSNVWEELVVLICWLPKFWSFGFLQPQNKLSSLEMSDCLHLWGILNDFCFSPHISK